MRPGAVRRDHAGLGDPGDVAGDQVHVRPLQRRVIGGGQQDPLAADGVVRGEPGPQRGVGDLLLQVPPAQPLQRGHQLLVHREAERPGLHQQVDGIADGARGQRDGAERGPQPGRDLDVGPRMDPRRRALEHGEVFRLFGHLRDELDRGRAGPDHRDPFARQVTGVIPACRVERGAAEPPGSRDVRVGGQVQRARGGHHRPRPVADQFTVLDGLDVPAPGALVPVHPLDRAAVPDVLVQAVLAGAVPQVVPDLPLGREEMAPVRVQLEGVRVERGRHVARAARILVVAPGPAEVVTGVQDHEVVVTRLLQRDPHPDAAEPGPDDHDPWHVWTITQDQPALTIAGPRPWPANHMKLSRLWLFEYCTILMKYSGGEGGVLRSLCLMKPRTNIPNGVVIHAPRTGSCGPRVGTTIPPGWTGTRLRRRSGRRGWITWPPRTSRPTRRSTGTRTARPRPAKTGSPRTRPPGSRRPPPMRGWPPRRPMPGGAARATPAPPGFPRRVGQPGGRVRPGMALDVHARLPAAGGSR